MRLVEPDGEEQRLGAAVLLLVAVVLGEELQGVVGRLQVR